MSKRVFYSALHEEYVQRSASFVTQGLVVDSIAASCLHCREPELEHVRGKCVFDNTWYTPYGRDRAAQLWEDYWEFRDTRDRELNGGGMDGG